MIAIDQSRHAMWLSDGNVGLLEKSLLASSGLNLVHAASLAGSIWDRETDNAMLVDDDATLHNNHASDPATDSLGVSDTAGFNMDWARGATQAVGISDTVHITLDGYHDENGSRYGVTANETINIGQPIYVSSANTVNLADAGTLNTSHVLGFAITDATANTTVIVLSEGSVTRDDWTTVTGLAALSPGAEYYLSTTAGQMSTSPPTGDGEHVVRVGTAITTTKFDIEVNEVAIL